MPDPNEGQIHNTVQNTSFDKPKQEDPAKKFFRILNWQPAGTPVTDDSLALSSFERMMQEQPVINLVVRQKNLELTHIKEIVRQLTEQGSSRKELIERISKNVDQYVNGQIVTALMLHMGDTLRDGAARAVGAQYEMVYGAKLDGGEIDKPTRSQRVETIEITQHDLVVNTLLNNGVDFRIFLGIVRKPAFAFAEFRKQISVSPPENDYLNLLCKRLIPSLALLHVLFSNEEIWKIVADEMGLQSLGREEVINAISTELGSFLGQTANPFELYRTGVASKFIPGQFEKDTQQLKMIMEYAVQEKERLAREATRVGDEIIKEQLTQKEDLYRKLSLEDQQEENRIKRLAEAEEKLKPARQAAEMLRKAPRPLQAYEKLINMFTMQIVKKEYFIPKPHPDLMAAEMELSRLEGEYESQKIPIPKHTENTPEIKAKLPQEIESLKRLLELTS